VAGSLWKESVKHANDLQANELDALHLLVDHAASEHDFAQVVHACQFLGCMHSCHVLMLHVSRILVSLCLVPRRYGAFGGKWHVHVSAIWLRPVPRSTGPSAFLRVAARIHAHA